MNREFVVKMMQAKKLEYEALKELVPERIENHINNLENEVFSAVKEYIMSEMTGESSSMKQNGEKKTAEKTGKKKMQKVTIES